MTAAVQPSQSGEQVRIQLSTRHTDLEFPQRTGPILVATSLKRYSLSTLVNALLADSRPTAQPIPFQFLINGHFLHGSLSDFLNQHGISAETTLGVEYVRAQTPPAYQSSLEHDDWVGAVDVLSSSCPASISSTQHVGFGQERILSGCYDGILRIWSPSGQVLASSAPDQDLTLDNELPRCVYAAKFLSPARIVSGGFGVPLRLWSYGEEAEAIPAPRGTLVPLADLKGHSAPLTPFDSIAVHPSTSRVLTASEDTNIHLWTIPASLPFPEDAQPTQHVSKKRRRTDTPQKQAAQVPALPPTATLSAHTRPVTSIIFHPTQPEDAAYSVSSDRTLRTWDIITETCVTSRTPSSDTPLSSLTALPSLSILAAGSVDRRILLVDPREDAKRSAVGEMRGCGGEVASLASEPPSSSLSSTDTESSTTRTGYGLISASYDGVVRVWDVRNTSAPTYRIPREAKSTRKSDKRSNNTSAKKLFSLVWDHNIGVVCGGEDGCVQVNQSP